MKTIAIIPARGGSKRLPGKNIRLLDGIPLIEHSINYAKGFSNIIDKIIVSTDSPEIKEVALGCGVLVIDRPQHLSTDFSTSVSALKHVLESLPGEEVKNVILLQPTNPLRPETLLQEAFDKFEEGCYESLMTVTEVRQKSGRIIEGRYIPINYKIGERSQDLEPLYFENGLLYIIKSSLILENKLLGEKNFSFIVNHQYSNVDIDELLDFEYAEFLLQKEKTNKK